ncbi:bifunctional diguanylate cyclase/phosphodiesterase [Leptolyngbya ohadii]|uniref:bifunctional diguanylate cyclase/phosphodiesterase n=1 Tax=Leptolyngbya ohadii TaxID=1962290 RepID=UPI0019D427F1|nr:EAL domain-containing protein [Leptolyngbya ohadii]
MSEIGSDQEHLLHSITSRIRQSLKLEEILTTAVQELGSFLKVDRVKVYRFDADGSGVVVAESIAEKRLPSLLGLRFPAGDIPPEARELFLKTRQRVIVDVVAQRKMLAALDCGETGIPLPAADLRYAPVDPCHIQYLLTMGVLASLVMPILHQNQLWGLVAVHNATPHHFSQRELEIVQLLIDQLSIAIAQSTLLQRVQQQASRESTLNRISSLLHCPLNQSRIRQLVLEETVRALEGSGGRLYLVADPGSTPAQRYIIGEQPTDPFIEESSGWQQLFGYQHSGGGEPIVPQSIGATWEQAGQLPMSLSITQPPVEKAAIEKTARESRRLRKRKKKGDKSDSCFPDEFGNKFGDSFGDKFTKDFGDSFRSKKVDAAGHHLGQKDLIEQEGLLSAHIFTDLFENPQFQSLAAAFESTPIRSVLVISLENHHQRIGWLTVFRNGYDTEILWAGKHCKDRRNQLPRLSFEAWCELKTDQSSAWQPEIVQLAQTIGIHLYMATMQKWVEGLLRHEASHDRLTRLPNRLLFDEQLSLALVTARQQGETLAVTFLDLDRFKTVNDTLGHAAGDQLLQQVTERLQSCVRQCDTISRWGGDEFTLLFPHLGSLEDMNKLAQRILDALSAPFNLEDQELYVSASLGIALFPYDGEDVDTLLKNADTAMYRAKQQGRNNYQLYCPEMNTQARERLGLETDLRKAIGLLLRDVPQHRAIAKDEFLLYYQPQIDIQTGEITSMEALIRWQHPQLGLVPPDQFIPLAEETGLIGAIGKWVMETACRQHRIWRDAGLPPIRIAVNLSADQFQHSLVQTIVQILQETQVEPQYLELEITESMAMQNVTFTISVLKELRDMGIQIAMDDFGTGYSSLNCIKHLPLHTLKIDRSFVQDLTTDPSDAAIARAVIALGQGLKLKIVAEGVETAEQLEFLRVLGCDVAQGYLFSKPLPADQVMDFVLNPPRSLLCDRPSANAPTDPDSTAELPAITPAPTDPFAECRKVCHHVRTLELVLQALERRNLEGK